MVDIAVAGGGLVGASFAAAIASDPNARGLSIALVDPHPAPPSIPERPGLRTSTISPSSRQFLRDIGVWEHVPRERVADFDDMIIWERQNGSGLVRFAADAGQDLGCVLDNGTLRYAIYARLRQLQGDGNKGFQLVTASIEDVVYADDRWPALQFGNNTEELAARLVVACDGARSKIRTRAGFKWFSKPYGQQAVVATVRMARPIATAYQRFLSTGPLAILPMADHYADDDTMRGFANIVWSTTTAEARALVGACDADFARELNIAVHESDDGMVSSDNEYGTVLSSNYSENERYALPVFTGVEGARGSFPLHCGHAPAYFDAAKRTVLVGDAAHNVHPLAGQGVNLGFADARSLSRIVGKAAESGTDFGTESTLARYQADRLPANMAMMGLLHSIHTMFGVRKAVGLRTLGMSLLNGAAPAKRAILSMMR